MIRAFIAIEIPKFEQLDVLAERLRGSGARISVPRTEGFHVTLKFLGDIEEGRVEEIRGAIGTSMDEFSKFDAEIRGTGAFPNQRNPRVLWVGIDDSGALTKMASAIDEKMSSIGFPREGRPFTPHLTLARVKSVSGIDRAMQIIEEYRNTIFGTFRIESVRLIKSTLSPNGSIYNDLAVIDLKDGASDRK